MRCVAFTFTRLETTPSWFLSFTYWPCFRPALAAVSAFTQTSFSFMRSRSRRFVCVRLKVCTGARPVTSR